MKIENRKVRIRKIDVLRKKKPNAITDRYRKKRML